MNRAAAVDGGELVAMLDALLGAVPGRDDSRYPDTDFVFLEKHCMRQNHGFERVSEVACSD